MFTATSDPERQPPTSARGADEVTVSEQTAALLVRQRAAEVVEVVETGESDDPAE